MMDMNCLIWFREWLATFRKETRPANQLRAGSR